MIRDIWARPPGDDGTIARQLRRRSLRNFVAIVSSVSLLAGAATYASMRESTAVSTTDVLAQYRADEAAGEPRTREANVTEGAKKRRPKAKARGAQRPHRQQRDQQNVAAPTDDQAAAATESQPNASASATEDRSAQQPRQAASPTSRRPDAPAEGVYEWQVDGYERGPGVERRLPARSHRVITHEGRRGYWVEHHIFSRQKEMWFNLMRTNNGGFSRSSRNRVEMGPVTVDRTVVFNPPIQVSSFPFKLGRTWRGSWSGKTHGTYTARTFEHTWLNIGGGRVEVWASEVVLEMRGEVEGSVVTRTWVSPKYNLAVKQYQMTNVTSGPGSYYSEWTGQTLSVRPQT